MDLVLASTSIYRRQLLQRLGLPFQCRAPGVEESTQSGEPPRDMALRLALAKAMAVAGSEPDSLVIGSDQVASLDGRIMGKPGNTANAVAQLARCSGKTVSFHTGLALYIPGRPSALQHVARYDVEFRDLSLTEIENYVAWDQPLDCAGSFKWESLGIALFKRLTGSDPTSLEGLPLIALTQMLAEAGHPVLERRPES